MSGGHWQYLRYKLEEHGQITKEALDLLGGLEHALDWGLSGDTCYDCAKIQVIAALEAFFNAHSGEETERTWQEVLADSYTYLCPRHQEREAYDQAQVKERLPRYFMACEADRREPGFEDFCQWMRYIISSSPAIKARFAEEHARWKALSEEA